MTRGGDYSKRWDIAAGTTNLVIYSGNFGQEMLSLNGSGLYVRGTFASSSDRNAKENFSEVNAKEVLKKVSALPISSWNYKADTAQHIGPMAQDFYAAFGTGTDDRHIATVDADGVALAAIKGLNEVVKEKDARIEKLEAANTDLAKRMAELEQMVRDLKK
jgi:hypothetical protein